MVSNSTRFAICAALLAALPILAGERLALAAAAPSDRFVAGGTVTEVVPVAGDLVAAGGSIDVDAAVAGDVIAAGGKVRIGGDVGQSVHAAAGQLSLLGRVARNARLAGGEVEIGPKAQVAGNLGVGAGRVAVRGPVDGHLSVGAGRALIDARIGGNVEVAAGELELGPNARIEGSLRYRSTEPLKRDAAAQVLGSVERLGPDPSRPPHGGRATATGLGVFWTAGIMLLAALVVALLPGVSASLSASLRERPGLSLVLGFVVFVCAPVAALVLLVTVIGIPLALLVLLGWLMLLPLAWVATAIGIGDWVIARVATARAARTGWRIAAALLGVLALAFVARVPWLGGLVSFAALLVGLGAWALQLRRLAAR